MSDEEKPLTPLEHQACQDLLLSLASQVRLLPLGRFLRAIEKADAVGPVLDPTLWMRGNKKLMVLKKMAEGALAFQNSLPKACEFCKVVEVAYDGAKYCGAGCSARAEAKEKRGE